MARNIKVFHNATYYFNSTVSLAYHNALEWFNIGCAKATVTLKSIQHIKWHPPFTGWHKINVYGSCIQNNRGFDPIAAGGLIRNGLGNWLSAYISFLRYGCSILAELWAIMIGIQYAIFMNIPNIIVESDCKFARDLISSDDHSSHHFSSLVHSIRLKLAKFQQASIQQVFREGKSCADALAKFE